MNSNIYQTQQIREFEILAQQNFNLSGSILMERAGEAACQQLLKRWHAARRIYVICGSGNNGGDGYMLAKFAQQRGFHVTIFEVGQRENTKAEAKRARQICVDNGLQILPWDKRIDLSDADVIVDALLGIGLKDKVKPVYAAAIEIIQAAQKPVFSIDIPSGIDADTGECLGVAIRADATITFIGLKLGLLTGHGIACSGDLILDDLQLPPSLFSEVHPIAEKLVVEQFTNTLKKRPRDWHKGLSGHVLIIGGELGYSGAPRMAGEAALRTGAGLVSIATVPENALVMNINCPEIMCHGIEEAQEVRPLMEKADVVVLGPGLGLTEWSKSLFEVALEYDHPMVVDADGLNLLSLTQHRKPSWILTPHPGEASRLLKSSVQNVQSDRLKACKQIMVQYGGGCVLKGAGTIIISDDSLPAVCDKGNPGMASAGMGDVLSGVIGGLIAQGVPMNKAAKLGVYLHALAGDEAASLGERGLMAMDLMPFLRQLVN